MKRTKSPKGIIFLVIVTSIIVISYSISRYQSTLASKSTGTVAKWDIELNTDYNDYVLFDNKKENEKNFTLKIKSESEVSSKYDIEIDGLYKEYKTQLSKDDYNVGYYFEGENLNIEVDENTITFDISKDSQTITNNEKDYYMEKYTTGGNTQINITNKTIDKSILSFTIDNKNKMEVIFRNCMEYVNYGKHEETYNLKIGTGEEELPAECNVKVYALFEQID